MNLQWKRGSLCWKIPVTFATEYSVFVHRSRHKHLQCCLDEFYNFFKNQVILEHRDIHSLYDTETQKLIIEAVSGSIDVIPPSDL